MTDKSIVSNKMDSLSIPILKRPRLNISTCLKDEYNELKARLVFLETIQCRNIMTKEQIDEERKIATQKFKLILTLAE
jgi:hypothetical protein